MKLHTFFGVSVFVASLILPGYAQAQLRGVNSSVDISVTAGAGSTTVNTGVKTNAQIKLQERIEKGKERAAQEIERRIKALTELDLRVEAMKKVSAMQKTNVSMWTEAEIASLNTLKAKIAASTDLETLKTDIQSITKSYRIFALIIPQGQIAVTADKVMTTAELMSTLNAKLKTRIDEAKAAGKDVSAMVTAQANIEAKLADAKVQAQAAVTSTATLTPDGGDEAKLKANKQALVDARAKLKVAHQDLQSAQQSVRTIIQGLKKLGVKASVNSTTTVR